MIRRLVFRISHARCDLEEQGRRRHALIAGESRFRGNQNGRLFHESVIRVLCEGSRNTRKSTALRLENSVLYW